MKKTIFPLLALLSLNAFSLELPSLEKIQEVAQSSSWLKLLHYKKNWTGGFTSLVDGPDFFFAKDGKNNPISELTESLKAFNNHRLKIGREKQSPQCAFPLRYRFLKDRLKINFKDSQCKKLDFFMKKFNYKKIFLSFSSAYPNSPGSMFGHTFLRISNSKEKLSAPLDYGLSYSALVHPDDDGLSYALRGIFGGYQGTFSIVPYYAKLNEYNNIEGRDIWEYELKMSPREIKNLLFHVWELEANSYFDYYFFSENCAYHILSLLEVVRPGLNLTDHFLFLAPADSIKKLTALPHFVKKIHFRPSLLRKASHLYSELSHQQKNLFHQSLREKSSKPLSDGKVLDSLISYLNYRKQSKEPTEKEKKKLKDFLLRRSQLNKISHQSTPQWASNQPDIGHDPHLLSIGGGHRRHPFLELHYRTAYHDLLANHRGHERFSELTFPSVTVRSSQSKFFLERINLLNLVSVTPFSPLVKKPSWLLGLRLFRERVSLSCSKNSCLKWKIYGGTGLTFRPFMKNSTLSLLGTLRLEARPSWREGKKIGPEFTALFLAQPALWYKSQVSYGRYYGYSSKKPILRQLFSWTHAFSFSRNLETRLFYSITSEEKTSHETGIRLLFYMM